MFSLRARQGPRLGLSLNFKALISLPGPLRVKGLVRGHQGRPEEWASRSRLKEGLRLFMENRNDHPRGLSGPVRDQACVREGRLVLGGGEGAWPEFTGLAPLEGR